MRPAAVFLWIWKPALHTQETTVDGQDRMSEAPGMDNFCSI